MLKTFYSWSGLPEKEDAFIVDGGFLKGIGGGGEEGFLMNRVNPYNFSFNC